MSDMGARIGSIPSALDRQTLELSQDNDAQSVAATYSPLKVPSPLPLPPPSYLNPWQVVGQGSFGVVYQAVVDQTGEVVAIKKVGGL